MKPISFRPDEDVAGMLEAVVKAKGATKSDLINASIRNHYPDLKEEIFNKVDALRKKPGHGH